MNVFVQHLFQSSWQNNTEHGTFSVTKVGEASALRRYLLLLTAPPWCHQCCAIETNINKCSLSLFSPILSQSARLVTGSISCVAFHSLACWWISPFYHYLSPSIWIRIKLFSFRHFPVTMRFLLLAASIGVAFSYPNGSFHILWVTTLMTKTDYREKNWWHWTLKESYCCINDAAIVFFEVSINLIQMVIINLDLIKLHKGAPSCSSSPRHGGGRGWACS